MALEVGIVGLPNVGKSTIFNALTAAGGAGGELPVRHHRAQRRRRRRAGRAAERSSTSSSRPRRSSPPPLRVVDIAGIVRGASTGEGLGNKFLSHIREVDAILHVVRCFEDARHHARRRTASTRSATSTRSTPSWRWPTSRRSARSLDKAERLARSGDKEATSRAEVLEGARPQLNDRQAGPPARVQRRRAEAASRALGLITAKKVLYVANVDEADIHGEGPLVQKVRDRAKPEGGGGRPRLRQARERSWPSWRRKTARRCSRAWA